MNINLEQKENKIYLKVSFKFRGKRGQTKIFKNSDAFLWIEQNYPNVQLGKVLSTPPKSLNNIDHLNGTWIFENANHNLLDNLNDNVTIERINIEADSSIEEKKEASLPNGLKKITKTKRKRATKKKTTEE